MIRAPKRAVTRFFIPLIDVLILLYCIFLLMPLVEKGATSGRLTSGQAEALRRRIAQLEEILAKSEQTAGSRDEVRRLEEELAEERSKRAADRILLKKLYLDRDKLTLYRKEETVQGTSYRREITRAADAVEMATADAKEDPSKELMYLILYPPKKVPPDGWASDVALKWFGRLARLEWQELDVGGGGS
jgi:hypothetical protein